MEIIFTNFKYQRTLIPLDVEKVDMIFIHHTASRTATPEQIQEWHKKFGGFGYNEYVRKDGRVYIGRGDHIGAHTYNHNSRSYGICLEGNYDIEPPPPVYLLQILAERVLEAQRRFPKAETPLPHFARFATNCPGRNFPMDRLYDVISDIKKKNGRITDIDEALQILLERGVINTPLYWKNSLRYYNYVEELILNFANYTNKK